MSDSLAVLLRSIGFLCGAFGVTLFPPILVSLWYQDGEWSHFLLVLTVAFALSVLLYAPLVEHQARLRRRDGFLIVALFWLVLSLLSSVPFMLGTRLGFVDSLFEAVSGITTTGATTIIGIDRLPRSMLYYRQQLQWLGGMGLIVLAVAIAPMLGIGGMQLYRAEAPGPMKEEKIAPRIAHSARSLWMIYLGLTLACAASYWLAGMTPFDAISHSFATISTGGFSTHDDSLAYFQSIPIEIIASIFMLAGGINFSVIYLTWKAKNPLYLFRDVEVRFYFLLILLVTSIVVIFLRTVGGYSSFWIAAVEGLFEVVSVMTSTGFGVADFSHWTLFLPVFLLFISFIGGCGGSTAGGMKVIRVLLLLRQGLREIRLLIHPRAVEPLKLGGRAVESTVMQAIWGFFALYVVVFVCLMLLMMATGVDHITAFSAVTTCMNNLGPGLGEVAYTFSSMGDSVKLISVAAMLLGRLEIFTLLVVLSPSFWREYS